MDPYDSSFSERHYRFDYCYLSSPHLLALSYEVGEKERKKERKKVRKKEIAS